MRNWGISVLSGIGGAQSRTMVALLLNVCHKSLEHDIDYFLLWEFKVEFMLAPLVYGIRGFDGSEKVC